jgi:hypothetical protein
MRGRRWRCKRWRCKPQAQLLQLVLAVAAVEKAAPRPTTVPFFRQDTARTYWHSMRTREAGHRPHVVEDRVRFDTAGKGSPKSIHGDILEQVSPKPSSVPELLGGGADPRLMPQWWLQNVSFSPEQAGLPLASSNEFGATAHGFPLGAWLHPRP